MKALPLFPMIWSLVKCMLSRCIQMDSIVAMAHAKCFQDPGHLDESRQVSKKVKVPACICLFLCLFNYLVIDLLDYINLFSNLCVLFSKKKAFRSNFGTSLPPAPPGVLRTFKAMSRSPRRSRSPGHAKVTFSPLQRGN